MSGSLPFYHPDPLASGSIRAAERFAGEFTGVCIVKLQVTGLVCAGFAMLALVAGG